LGLEYSLDAMQLTNGSWTGVDGGTFLSPDCCMGTPGPRNGNSATDSRRLSSTITDLSIPDGGTFMLRWTDVNEPFAPDDGLAVDDLSITAGGRDCNDGIDNDSDGAVDYPADPGCTDAADQDETDPSLRIGDRVVLEGDSGTTTNARFAVSMSEASRVPVSVDYQTADATAVSGADFTPASGSVRFDPGQTSKSITVHVAGDALDEPTEAYSVNLSAPSSASIADGVGAGAIRDDDPPPTISVSDPAPRPEGVGLRFTVALSNPSSRTVTVRYGTADVTATAPGDYTAKSGTLKFVPGTTSRSLTIRTIDDGLPEGDETFTLGITHPVNASIGDGTSVATIRDNDSG
jgi:hypothetical protein